MVRTHIRKPRRDELPVKAPPDPRYECPLCGKLYGSYEYPYGVSVGAQGMCGEHGAFWVPIEAPYDYDEDMAEARRERFRGAEDD